MREQGGSFAEIASGLTAKSYTVTGLTLGTTYEFVIESRNSLGYSATSDVLTFLHAIPPNQPVAPVTTNNN